MITTASVIDSLKEWQAWDESRESVPGEHWLVFGAGLAVLLATSRSSSTFHRIAGAAIGSAMIYRAASGRDGITRLLDQLPISKALEGEVSYP